MATSTPSTWRVVHLGDAITLSRGMDLPIQSRSEGRCPVIGSNGIVGYHAAMAAHGPGVLVGRSGSVGEVTYIEEDYWPLNTTLWVRDFHGNDPLFTSLFLRHLNLGRFTAGVSVPTLNRNILHRIEVKLPPVPEQRAIAHVLQTVQKAKEAREREQALERERKAALMEHLFTHGTSNATPATTDAGRLPSNWPLKPLGEVADVVYGVQAAVAHLTNPSSGIPILTNVNITNEGALDLGTLRYFPLAEKMRTRALLAKGDVLFNWRSGSQNHVGKTAIFEKDGEFTFSSFILRFRPTDTLFNRFLFYFLQTIKARGYFAQNRQQSSVNSVFNASVAATIPVPVPKLAEQQEIAFLLAACDMKLRALEAEMRCIEELFSSFLDELMTGSLSVSTLARKPYHNE